MTKTRMPNVGLKAHMDSDLHPNHAISDYLCNRENLIYEISEHLGMKPVLDAR